MLIACSMCGGILEAGGAVTLAAASMIGAELFNRARAAVHNRNRAAARLARIIGADKLAAEIPPAARFAELSAKLRRDHRELAAELAAS